ncbi:MAG: hypothetical protein ACMXYA_00595 [Candidatus Woesearchaeota archaeon]
MRKSNLSRSEIQERNKKILTIVVALFFIGTMVFGSFAFIFLMNPTGQIGSLGNNAQTSVEEFGQRFQIVQSGNTQWWQTDFNGVEAFFYLLPSQVGTFPIQEEDIDLLTQADLVYLTFNSSDSNVSVFVESISLLADTFTQLQIPFDIGIVEEESLIVEDLPQYTCADATQTTPVIQITLDNDLGFVSVGDNCYQFVAIDALELIYLTEFLRYRLYGLDI